MDEANEEPFACDVCERYERDIADLRRQLAEAKAREAKMREALVYIAKEANCGYGEDSYGMRDTAKEALSKAEGDG